MGGSESFKIIFELHTERDRIIPPCTCPKSLLMFMNMFIKNIVSYWFGILQDYLQIV